jgi:hypothetical protein
MFKRKSPVILVVYPVEDIEIIDSVLCFLEGVEIGLYSFLYNQKANLWFRLFKPS